MSTPTVAKPVLALFDAESEILTRFDGVKATHSARAAASNGCLTTEIVEDFRMNPPAEFLINSGVKA